MIFLTNKLASALTNHANHANHHNTIDSKGRECPVDQCCCSVPPIPDAALDDASILMEQLHFSKHLQHISLFLLVSPLSLSFYRSLLMYLSYYSLSLSLGTKSKLRIKCWCCTFGSWAVTGSLSADIKCSKALNGDEEERL